MAAFSIIAVLFTLNIFGIIKPRSSVDLIWAWISTAFFGAGVWLQPTPAIIVFFVVYVILTALNTWIGLRGS